MSVETNLIMSNRPTLAAEQTGAGQTKLTAVVLYET